MNDALPVFFFYKAFDKPLLTITEKEKTSKFELISVLVELKVLHGPLDSHISAPIGFVNANRKQPLKVFSSQGSSSGQVLSKSPQNWFEFMYLLPFVKL